MRVLVQRVACASVSVSGETIGEINRGLLLFAGFTGGDSESTVAALAGKAANLRIFPDQDQRLQFSVMDIGGQILAVPQFTLYANVSRGRRPDFTRALEPNAASRMFDCFIASLEDTTGAPVARGEFGADMQVSLVNDGPFTISLEQEP